MSRKIGKGSFASRLGFFERKIREVKSGQEFMEKIRKDRLERRIEQQEKRLKDNSVKMEKIRQEIRTVDRSIIRLKKEAARLRGVEYKTEWSSSGEEEEEKELDKKVTSASPKKEVEKVPRKKKIEEEEEEEDIVEKAGESEPSSKSDDFLEEDASSHQNVFQNIIQMKDYLEKDCRLIYPREISDVVCGIDNMFHIFCPGAEEVILLLDDHFWVSIPETREGHFEGTVFIHSKTEVIDVFSRYQNASQDDEETVCLLTIGQDKLSMVERFKNLTKPYAFKKWGVKIRKPKKPNELKKGTINKFHVEVDPKCKEVSIVMDDGTIKQLTRKVKESKKKKKKKSPKKKKKEKYYWEGEFSIPHEVNDVDIYGKFKSKPILLASFDSEDVVEEEASFSFVNIFLKKQEEEAKENFTEFKAIDKSYFSSSNQHQNMNILKPLICKDLKYGVRNNFRFQVSKELVDIAIVFGECDWNFMTIIENKSSKMNTFIGDFFVPNATNTCGIYVSKNGVDYNLIGIWENMKEKKKKVSEEEDQKAKEEEEESASPFSELEISNLVEKPTKKNDVFKYRPYYVQNCKLLHPAKISDLKWGQVNEFRIIIPKAKEVALVVDDSEYYYLTRMTKDYLWETELVLETYIETLEIFARFSSSDSKRVRVHSSTGFDCICSFSQDLFFQEEFIIEESLTPHHEEEEEKVNKELEDNMLISNEENIVVYNQKKEIEDIDNTFEKFKNFQILSPLSTRRVKKGNFVRFVVITNTKKKYLSVDEKMKKNVHEEEEEVDEIVVLEDDVIWNYLSQRDKVNEPEVWDGIISLESFSKSVDCWVSFKKDPSKFYCLASFVNLMVDPIKKEHNVKMMCRNEFSRKEDKSMWYYDRFHMNIFHPNKIMEEEEEGEREEEEKGKMKMEYVTEFRKKYPDVGFRCAEPTSKSEIVLLGPEKSDFNKLVNSRTGRKKSTICTKIDFCVKAVSSKISIGGVSVCLFGENKINSEAKKKGEGNEDERILLEWIDLDQVTHCGVFEKRRMKVPMRTSHMEVYVCCDGIWECALVYDLTKCERRLVQEKLEPHRFIYPDDEDDDRFIEINDISDLKLELLPGEKITETIIDEEYFVVDETPVETPEQEEEEEKEKDDPKEEEEEEEMKSSVEQSFRLSERDMSLMRRQIGDGDDEDDEQTDSIFSLDELLSDEKKDDDEGFDDDYHFDLVSNDEFKTFTMNYVSRKCVLHSPNRISDVKDNTTVEVEEDGIRIFKKKNTVFKIKCPKAEKVYLLLNEVEFYEMSPVKNKSGEYETEIFVSNFDPERIQMEKERKKKEEKRREEEEEGESDPEMEYLDHIMHRDMRDSTKTRLKEKERKKEAGWEKEEFDIDYYETIDIFARFRGSEVMECLVQYWFVPPKEIFVKENPELFDGKELKELEGKEEDKVEEDSKKKKKHPALNNFGNIYRSKQNELSQSLRLDLGGVSFDDEDDSDNSDSDMEEEERMKKRRKKKILEAEKELKKMEKKEKEEKEKRESVEEDVFEPQDFSGFSGQIRVTEDFRRLECVLLSPLKNVSEELKFEELCKIDFFTKWSSEISVVQKMKKFGEDDESWEFINMEKLDLEEKERRMKKLMKKRKKLRKLKRKKKMEGKEDDGENDEENGCFGFDENAKYFIPVMKELLDPEYFNSFKFGRFKGEVFVEKETEEIEIWCKVDQRFVLVMSLKV